MVMNLPWDRIRKKSPEKQTQIDNLDFDPLTNLHW